MIYVKNSFPKNAGSKQRRSHSVYPTRDATDVRHSCSEFLFNSASNMKEKNQNKYLVRTKLAVFNTGARIPDGDF